MPESQLDLTLPVERDAPTSTDEAAVETATTAAVAARVARTVRVSDAALRARIAAGQTPVLFDTASPTGARVGG